MRQESHHYDVDVARWEPDARERLVRAALDLFGEQGYDATTVAQIAERAGLTKSTFFRHFPDKRELLVAGQDTLATLLTEGAAAAPDSATPMETVLAALDATTAAFTPDRRELGPKLQAAIAASAELQERDTLKHVGLAAILTEALHRRGVPDPAASLAAEIGMLAFKRAYARWVTAGETAELAALTREELRAVQAATSTLT